MASQGFVYDVSKEKKQPRAATTRKRWKLFDSSSDEEKEWENGGKPKRKCTRNQQKGVKDKEEEEESSSSSSSSSSSEDSDEEEYDREDNDTDYESEEEEEKEEEERGSHQNGMLQGLVNAGLAATFTSDSD